MQMPQDSAVSINDGAGIWQNRTWLSIVFASSALADSSAALTAGIW